MKVKKTIACSIVSSLAFVLTPQLVYYSIALLDSHDATLTQMQIKWLVQEVAIDPSIVIDGKAKSPDVASSYWPSPLESRGFGATDFISDYWNKPIRIQILIDKTRVYSNGKNKVDDGGRLDDIGIHGPNRGFYWKKYRSSSFVLIYGFCLSAYLVICIKYRSITRHSIGVVLSITAILVLSSLRMPDINIKSNSLNRNWFLIYGPPGSIAAFIVTWSFFKLYENDSIPAGDCCSQCGYSREGLRSSVCPECGYKHVPYKLYSKRKL